MHLRVALQSVLCTIRISVSVVISSYVTWNRKHGTFCTLGNSMFLNVNLQYISFFSVAILRLVKLIFLNVGF